MTDLLVIIGHSQQTLRRFDACKRRNVFARCGTTVWMLAAQETCGPEYALALTFLTALINH